MSDINNQFGFSNLHAFDETFFRREDNLLNVFKDSIWTPQSSERKNLNDLSWNDNLIQFQPNFSYHECIQNEANSFVNIPGSKEKQDNFSHTCVVESPFIPLQIILSEEKGKQEWNDTIQIENSNSNTLSSTGEDMQSSKPVTKTTQREQNCSSSDMASDKASDKAPGSKSKNPNKMFSRRKDVIIKTLLRKCRKFFLKDFNSKTNYLKTAKRKFGSSVYKSLLEDYINRVFQIPCSRKMLIFLGVFLYQQDLEDNLDLFASPNYSPKDIKTLIMTVHEILYKYSHQKFYYFSKNEEFKFLFNYFEKLGTEEVKTDREYALGLDIIRGQL